MIILKCLIGIIIFIVGLIVGLGVLVLLFYIVDLIEKLIKRLKKYKTFRAICKVGEWIKITLIIILVATMIIGAGYSIGDMLF